jgi:hypothetical protein
VAINSDLAGQLADFSKLMAEQLAAALRPITARLESLESAPAWGAEAPASVPPWDYDVMDDELASAIAARADVPSRPQAFLDPAYRPIRSQLDGIYRRLHGVFTPLNSLNMSMDSLSSSIFSSTNSFSLFLLRLTLITLCP